MTEHSKFPGNTDIESGYVFHTHTDTHTHKTHNLLHDFGIVIIMIRVLFTNGNKFLKENLIMQYLECLKIIWFVYILFAMEILSIC